MFLVSMLPMHTHIIPLHVFYKTFSYIHTLQVKLNLLHNLQAYSCRIVKQTLLKSVQWKKQGNPHENIISHRNRGYTKMCTMQYYSKINVRATIGDSRCKFNWVYYENGYKNRMQDIIRGRNFSKLEEMSSLMGEAQEIRIDETNVTRGWIVFQN